eukprot:1632523-Rhodomonas_salina.1
MFRPTAPLLLLLSLSGAAGFVSSPLWSVKAGGQTSVAASQRVVLRSGAGGMTMKDWSKRATLAEKEGNSADDVSALTPCAVDVFSS